MFDNSKNLWVTGRSWISVDSVDKSMDLIIQNPTGYGADLDRILKFVKRVWIKVDSRQTCPIARSSDDCTAKDF